MLLNLRVWLFILLLPLLPACGYRRLEDPFCGQYTTISIPYVPGDLNGDLTAALTHEISASSGFQHVDFGGQLILMVQLVGVENENIGFRFEQLHGKKYKRSIIPVETRLMATAEVSLINAATGCTILPSVLLSAYVDIDHEYNASYTDSSVFSLGQLTDADSAFEVARAPLNRLLAHKIVEYIQLNAMECKDPLETLEQPQQRE